MYSHPASSNRPSPSRHGHRQARSHQQITPNNLPQNFPTSAKHQTSSLRLPQRSSVNLVSIISKFEALDSLSSPFKIPGLQPLPSQVSRNSTRHRGGTGIDQQSKAANIFSPRTGSGNRYGEVSPADRLTSRADDVYPSANTATRDSPLKFSSSERLQAVTPPNNPCNIKLRGSINGPLVPSQGNRDETFVLQSMQNEVAEKRYSRTVRDIISFYDGSVSVGTNTQANPSLIETPKTPLSRLRVNDNKTFSLSNNLSSKRNITPRKTIDSYTPTKRSPLVVSTKRNLIFGSTTPSPSLSPTSPVKYSTKSGFPDSLHYAPTSGQASAGIPETSLIRIRTTCNRMSASMKSRDALFRESEVVAQDEERGRSLVKSTRNKKLASLNSRKIGDKIENIYGTKSLERQKELSQEPDYCESQAFDVNSRSRLVYESRQFQAESSKPRGRQEPGSKIARMKILFEKGAASGVVVTAARVHLPENLIAEMAIAAEEMKAISRPQPQLRPPPTPPPLPSFTTSRTTSNVSPKTVPKPKAVDVSPTQNLNSLVKPCHPIGRHNRPSHPKSKVIGDKMRMFEAIPEGREQEGPHERMAGLSWNMNKSLVGLNRPWETSSKVHNIKKAHGHGLSSKDIHDIYAEFHGVEEATRTGKRKPHMERWNYVIPVPTSTGTDGAASDKTADSPFTEDLTDMVIKEVDCRLREPKPLRIVEMKRMMFLCRGRAGVFVMDKGKGNSVHSRKLSHY